MNVIFFHGPIEFLEIAVVNIFLYYRWIGVQESIRRVPRRMRFAFL